MTNYDITLIFKLLQKTENELESRIADLQNRYQIFRELDCLDLLELQELKFNLQFFRKLEQDLLQLIKYLSD